MASRPVPSRPRHLSHPSPRHSSRSPYRARHSSHSRSHLLPRRLPIPPAPDVLFIVLSGLTLLAAGFVLGGLAACPFTP